MRLRFAARWWPTLATALLVPAFTGLGFWQLDRAGQKAELQAEYDARLRGPLVAVGARVQPAEELRFYRVVAKGRYDSAHQIFIDNRVQQGRVGYHVVTPLKLEASETRVLVNRGWIALGRDREHLPAVETPAGVQEITGVAVVPAEHVFTLGKPAAAGGPWETVWQNIDMQRFKESVGYPVQPVVVLLDPHSPAGGLVRDWSRLDAGIATHKAYAFQWFVLAFALLVTYIVMNTRKRR
ncbi:MAG: SURF1 family protein [Gammaproteobacteria bacterium]|nr:SURF1 family protein [Gammaproteobacteria bacterium]